MFNFLKPTWLFILLDKDVTTLPMYITSSKAWTLQGAIDNLEPQVLDLLEELINNEEVQGIVCHMTLKHFVIKNKLWTKSNSEKR